MSLPTPLLPAPVGVIGLCAQDGHGDLATARAAATSGVPIIVSTLLVDPLESVDAQFGDTPGLFHLYPPRDRKLTESFVSRAKAVGFRASSSRSTPACQAGGYEATAGQLFRLLPPERNACRH